VIAERLRRYEPAAIAVRSGGQPAGYDGRP